MQRQVTMDRYPTTFAQASVWFAHQWQGVTSAYNVSVTILIEGKISCSSVERACHEVVTKTPALRARFGIDESGEVIQWFPPKPIPLEVIRYTGEASAKQVNQLVEQEIRRPIEPEGEPLARFSILRVGHHQTVVVLIAHHCIMDGLSQGIIANRFIDSLTGNFWAGSQQSEYLDLTEGIRQAEKTALEQEPGYWSGRIYEGLGQNDWAWPEMRDDKAGRVRAYFSEQRMQVYKQLAKDLNISLFSTIVGEIHWILGKFGMSRSVICTAASLRPRHGMDDRIVGCFINQIPLISVHNEGENVVDLLRREASKWREDLKHRFVPLSFISDSYRSASGARIRLDRIYSSYREHQAGWARKSGGLSVKAHIFNVYYEAKTDMTVRFMFYGDRLAYDIEWAMNGHRGLGSDLAEVLQSMFRGTGKCLT